MQEIIETWRQSEKWLKIVKALNLREETIDGVDEQGMITNYVNTLLLAQQTAFRELIDIYKEYTGLLEESESSNLGFLFAHGIKIPKELVEKGVELREKIKSLSSSLSLTEEI